MISGAELAEFGPDELLAYDNDVERLDHDILELLSIRFRIAAEVARIKSRRGLPAGISDGAKQALAAREKAAQNMALPPGAAFAIWSAIAEETGKFEADIISTENADHAAASRQFQNITNA